MIGSAPPVVQEYEALVKAQSKPQPGERPMSRLESMNEAIEEMISFNRSNRQSLYLISERLFGCEIQEATKETQNIEPEGLIHTLEYKMGILRDELCKMREQIKSFSEKI